MRAIARSAQGPPRVPVQLAPAKSTQVEETSEYVASMESRRSVDLMPEVAARVLRIPVKPGDWVQAGQIVFLLDESEERAAVRNSEALLTAAQESLRLARIEYERDVRLWGTGSISAQQFDQSRTNRETAEANVNARAAELRANQVLLAYCRVAAPIEGAIGDIPVRVGEWVTQSTILTTVDQRRLHVDISIPVERQAEIRLELPVRLLDATGTVTDQAAVDFVSSRVDPPTQTVLVKATIPNPAGTLRPDQFTRAQMSGARPSKWWCRRPPSRGWRTALRFRGQPEDAGFVARQRPVRLGNIVDNQYVVLEGLSADEPVVVSGAQKLFDGMPIRAGS